MPDKMNEELFKLLAARKGHFRLESNHHGELWLDLELLCLRPGAVRPFAVELARRMAGHRIEAVCGPLVEGAFVALMVAGELGAEFVYAERFARPGGKELYPVEYRLPEALRRKVCGRRVAIVNDVINAGSAVRGTWADLQACGAETMAVGALLVLGTWAEAFAADKGVALESIATVPNRLWRPEECPLCAAGMPMEAPGHKADG